LAIETLESGKPIFISVSVYDTNSTGKLAFLDNQVGIFKVEPDKQGNFVNKEWGGTKSKIYHQYDGINHP
jgi:hypothetical protein